MALQLLPAARFPHAQLAALINQAYADYFMPVWMNGAQFAQMCREEDVLLERSVVAVANGEPVGITLLSQRGARGWVSGVGVLPLWRRQGIARQLLEFCQGQARVLRLKTLALEVLVQNEGAVALYEQFGFEWQRDFLVLVAEADLFESQPLPEAITPADPAMLLAHYADFHEIPASWQRDLPTLRHRVSYLAGLQFQAGGRCVGYLLYQSQRYHHYIHDLAVAPEWLPRVGTAQALLQAMHGRTPQSGGYIINVPVTDPLLLAFTRLDYRIWQRQYEMVWAVT